ncbi:nucleolin 1-like isoform X2 [Solanum stenotomum]|uniref:nucleolin 1-like isoform X2 n=1 Tax=Solanum stenotomum TaxID=172797 RepID=UPI0020D0236F|nr:nucleolin 1-like isoform X2 [Solanum stenotomum]
MMGSNRREEGSVMVKNSNVFAALDTLRKKKKSDKEKSKGSSKKEQEPEVLWAPAPLTVKSWADVDDEDDDDYYATTAPLQSFVGSIESGKKPEPVEETESEDDLLDDDEDVEDNDHESEVPEHAEPVGQKIEASPAPKEAERQLSKKERRKKELAELEALLADFGVEQKENGPEDLPDVANEKKEGQPSEDVEKKNSGATEPKSAKKKKKKDKASKEVKESEDQPNNVDATTGPEETRGAGPVEDVSTVDMKERLKRVASAKKKKSGKETDAAARAAAIEAAARNSKLAAAKKKEKSHYNQQPTR